MDQGLIHRKKLKDGREVEFWGYGGDWESPWPDDAQFNINGLIWPDRTPHPSMWECKAVMVRRCLCWAPASLLPGCHDAV